MEISCRVYKPRRAHESPLYRLVEQHLEGPLRLWPQRFARTHGSLRQVVERGEHRPWPWLSSHAVRINDRFNGDDAHSKYPFTSTMRWTWPVAWSQRTATWPDPLRGRTALLARVCPAE